MYPPTERASMLPVRCRKCEAEIPRDARECPECGYDPAGTARDVGAVLLLLSVPLTVAIPPLGVLGMFVAVVVLGWSLLASPAG